MGQSHPTHKLLHRSWDLDRGLLSSNPIRHHPWVWPISLPRAREVHRSWDKANHSGTSRGTSQIRCCLPLHNPNLGSTQPSTPLDLQNPDLRASDLVFRRPASIPATAAGPTHPPIREDPWPCKAITFPRHHSTHNSTKLAHSRHINPTLRAVPWPGLRLLVAAVTFNCSRPALKMWSTWLKSMPLHTSTTPARPRTNRCHRRSKTGF